jgi:small subunit ribosomal protein S5
MAEQEQQQAQQTQAQPEQKRGRGRGRGRGGNAEGGEGGENRGRRRRGEEGGENREGREEGSEFVERLVGINRVSKTVKGGRRFAFAALMVVGDGKGRVGHGHAKSREVPEAIKKATEQAKRNMIRVPLREGRTIHHDVKGRHGAGKVLLRSAPQGTGIIAGGPMRAVFESLGIQDVVAKAVGSSNPYSMVNATFDALQNIQSPRHVAARRNKKVSDVVAGREAARSGAEAAMDEDKE